MQLYCRGGLVVAIHADEQAVPPSAYGEDVVVVPYVGSAAVADLLGRPIPPTDLAVYANACGYAAEIAGITVGSQTIKTDRESQALINGADRLAERDPTASIDFRSADGWVTLDAAAIAIIALEVGRHVRACFAKRREVEAEIAAGTITSLAHIDAAFASLG